KVLLAFASGGHRRLQGTDLTAYTKRTIRTHSALAAALALVRHDGLATEDGELEADRGSMAAPVHGTGGLAVAAVAIFGPRDELFDGRSRPDQDLANATKATARALTRQVQTLW
ncbi:MAG: IclR family transcriptional regulator domain-containing protein, partial [Kribbellaceae bacterium]